MENIRTLNNNCVNFTIQTNFRCKGFYAALEYFYNSLCYCDLRVQDKNFNFRHKFLDINFRTQQKSQFEYFVTVYVFERSHCDIKYDKVAK